jgi:hypothetical protein
VYTLPPGEIEEMINKTRQINSRYEPPPWNKRYALHYDDATTADPLVEQLLSWKAVQQAYVAPRLAAPAALTGTNPLSNKQWYLKVAPAGIDADYVAQNVGGGAGEGQDLIDLEAGWVTDHPDLVDQNIPAPIVGDNLVDNVWRPHGTMVLGVICAVDNDMGVVGAASHLASVQLASHDGKESQFQQAMLIAVNRASRSPRSVLLLETSLVWLRDGPDLPFESDPWMFEDIQKAVRDSELVIVEPAGNGGQNLDTYFVDKDGNPKLDRNNPARDSGAIIVGSAYNTNLQAYWPGDLTFSWSRRDCNYGNRIDCFAWGEMVYTTDPNAPMPTVPYSTNFSGTSSASAIVAGAALVVQGMAQNNLGSRLPPGQVRQLLSDPTVATAARPLVNTPSSAPNVDQIGVMPNLRAIADWMLNPQPQEPQQLPEQLHAPRREPPNQHKKPHHKKSHHKTAHH